MNAAHTAGGGGSYGQGQCEEEGCPEKGLKATRGSARGMAEADAASRRAVPRQLQAAALFTARRMAEADAASRGAVLSQLEPAALFTAWRMAEASAAGRTTASS